MVGGSGGGYSFSSFAFSEVELPSVTMRVGRHASNPGGMPAGFQPARSGWDWVYVSERPKEWEPAAPPPTRWAIVL